MANRYTYIHKKSKKKAKKTDSVRWLASSLYILGFALDAWLFAILWFGVDKAVASRTLAVYLNQLLGQGTALIPLFLSYWLVRSLVKKTSAFVFFLIGSLVTLTAFSSVLTLLKRIFADSQITGGAAGEKLFLWFEGIAGTVGAALFSLAVLLIGLHMLFAIPWRTILQKTAEFLRDDFQDWMEARAELKEKVKEAQKELKEAPLNTPAIIQSDAEAEPAPSKPKIYRGGQIKAPVADMVKELPRGNKPAPTAQPADAEEAGENLADRPPFNPATFQLPSLDLLAIALAMKAKSIRVEAPIPGKDAIGFEIPNDRPVMVTMKEILQDPVYTQSKARIPVGLGRYADGVPAGATLEKWPHILIAGATNSGKSICLHTIIMSVLYHAKPNEVKFLMIDPKRLELTLYEGIPHLYDPKTSCDDVNVVTDAQGAVKSLQMLVKVMEKRLQIMELAKVKNIEGYNAWAEKKGEEKMFYIIVIIDEMADLMLQTRAAIEDSVQRLAQMARAVGIHLILCTQRPSVNVITGVIKANLPSRIALQVASKTDSRVILDGAGAELLLGRGDMLYQGTSDQKPHRIQGAYVSENEITAVADFLRAQGAPDYPVQILADHSLQRPQDGLGTSPEELLAALTLITQRRRVSQDLLKAHFGSSARATNILSVLEMKGFITKPEGSNRWEIHYDMIEEQIRALQNRETDKYQEPEYETVYK